MVRIFECLLRMHVWRPRRENHKFMGSLNFRMKTFPKQTKQNITVFSRENLSQTLLMLYYIFIDKTIKLLWGRQSSLKNNMYGLLRFIFYFNCVYMCVCIHMSEDAHERQKRSLDFLELELPVQMPNMDTVYQI